MHFKRCLSYKSLVSWYAGLTNKRPAEAPFNHIVQIGDPTLRAVAEHVPPELIKSDEIKFLINRMHTVMNRYGCVGLAAPQIGISLNLFLMEVTKKHLQDISVSDRKTKEMEIVPLKVVINPSVKITDYRKLNFIENCESVRGFHAEVPRFRSLKLKGLNEEGVSFEMEAVGWPARIIQHEMDHLNGVIYTDVMDRKSLTCSCWQVINDRQGKVELPYRIN